MKLYDEERDPEWPCFDGLPSSSIEDLEAAPGVEPTPSTSETGGEVLRAEGRMETHRGDRAPHRALDFAHQMKWLVRGLTKTIRRLDNLNTHKPLYEAFEPADARRIAKRLELHYTPVHGSRPR